jgi:hypothetical protein
MNLTQIQHVIEELPAEEQTALAAWIVDRDRLRDRSYRKPIE